MKRFVTIFPACENVHLVKDVGQIPYFMSRMFGYDASILTYKNSAAYPYLGSEAGGLKLEFIENKGRRSFLETAVLDYLREQSGKIDVLNLYHYSKYSFAYGLLYKRYNPAGKIFLKIDAYNETFAGERPLRFSENPLKNWFFRRLEKRFLKKADILSIETREGERLLKQRFPAYHDKIIYLPVGVNDIYLRERFPRIKTFAEKENIILATGRIGEPVKNHEMILRSLARVELRDWKFVFVGAVNKDFQAYTNNFIAQNGHLKDKIIFTGLISDRQELFEWYNRSRIVCMSSHKESFCHTMVEGLYFGNYLLGTEGIMSMNDLTDNEKYGKIIPANNDMALATQLQHLINSPARIADLYPQSLEHARKNFTWSHILPALHQKLEKV